MIGTVAGILAPPLAVLGGLTYATVAPSCQFWGPSVARGRADSRQVALTFDDGPTPGPTDAILDILRAASVRASFFVVGVNVIKHPDLLRRIRDEGHLICNHSHSHSHFAMMRRRPYWIDEIVACDEAVGAAIGSRPKLYRPAMGVKTWHTFAALRQTGHTLVTWSSRARDGLPTTPQRIMQRFEGVRPGEIMLLHDGVEPHAPHADRSATIAALPMLLERLRQLELTPVRLDEMLGVAAT
jgi:peptidoglycan/xylan/chitin deacetylase (PgdA/CDA1 family)